MKQSGFVISLDSLAALSVLLTILTFSAFYINSVEFSARNNALLKENTMDALVVMEKQGMLADAIASDKVNDIRAFMNQLPGYFCIDLAVYNENDLNSPVLSVLRPGCEKNFDYSATLNRSFVVGSNDANFYIARATGWFKVN